jgi:glycosyltransferase involved in cell wall biosynthesis
MRVLMVHNYYEHPGGEDRVFEAEVRLLRARGHEVIEHIAHNHTIGSRGKLGLAVETIWSRRARAALVDCLTRSKPDVAHFHNTFPLVSPAAYSACRAAGVPVVQTLHNYRLGCPKATYFRANAVCEQCLGKLFPWPGIVHACYRNSRTTTAVVAAMTSVHHVLGTWANQVDTYIALSEFARRKLVQSGLPAERILVKGNFLDQDPGPGQHDGGFFLFAGRLTAEKGLESLLAAWRRLSPPPPLRIVGDGPLAGWLRQEIPQHPAVEWLGPRSPHEVAQLMGAARAVLVPSAWYEPFGLVVIEAFASGTPVIAARLGALPEIVEHGRTGVLHYPADPEDLAARVEWAWQHPSALADMGRQARQVYEQRYTAQHNYTRLMDIYAAAAAAARTTSA